MIERYRERLITRLPLMAPLRVFGAGAGGPFAKTLERVHDDTRADQSAVAWEQEQNVVQFTHQAQADCF